MSDSAKIARCSEACTRAGITAILMVAVAVALLEPLDKYQEAQKAFDTAHKNYQEQVDYRILRQRLAETVEFLTIDPCFRVWSHSHNVNLELLTLQEIADKIDCTKVAGTSEQFLQWAVESQVNSSSINSPAFLLPPEHLLVESHAILREITGAIVDLLKANKRFQDNTLIARHGLAFETYLALKLRERHHWIPDRVNPGPYTLHARYGPRVMPISDEDLRKHLTVGGALELIKYYMPDQPPKPEPPSNLGISIPQVSVPVDPLTAAVVVQFIFTISLGYFLLFQKEASRLSKSSFLENATLFSVFQQSTFARTAFVVLCITPVVASFALALAIQDRPIVGSIMYALFIGLSLMAVTIARDFLRLAFQPVLPKPQPYSSTTII